MKSRKRIAVVLAGSTGQSVVRGKATLVVDKDLGKCLRVRLSGELGDPQMYFSDSIEDYDIKRDNKYGCDYRLTIEIDAGPCYLTPGKNGHAEDHEAVD